MTNPDRARDRSLFAAGLRSVNYGMHVIFFARIQAMGNDPVILRIVHQRRHMPALVYFEDLDVRAAARDAISATCRTPFRSMTCRSSSASLLAIIGPR